MTEYQKILVPIDFSECSFRALDHAATLASKLGAELHLLHVFDPPTSTYAEFGIGYVGIEEVEKKMVEEAAQRLHNLPEFDTDPALRVTRSVKTGQPHVEIVEYASKSEISLIVIGASGRSGLTQFLLGSTTDRVIRKAECPVMIVHLNDSKG